jgi:hypothetical protein
MVGGGVAVTTVLAVLGIIRAARRAKVFRVALSAAIDAARDELAAELLAQIGRAGDCSMLDADPHMIGGHR